MRPRRLLALFAVAVLTGCATKIPPPPAAPTHAELEAIWAANYTCRQADYIDVNIRDVVSTPGRYYEKCIRLRALFANKSLFRDATSLKTAESGLAVAVKDGKIPVALQTHPQFVVAAGRLRSCTEIDRQIFVLNMRASAAATVRAPAGAEVLASFHDPNVCDNRAGPQLFVVTLEAMPTAMD